MKGFQPVDKKHLSSKMSLGGAFSMYRKKNREIQVEEVKISLEALVPENHISIRDSLNAPDDKAISTRTRRGNKRTATFRRLFRACW